MDDRTREAVEFRQRLHEASREVQQVAQEETEAQARLSAIRERKRAAGRGRGVMAMGGKRPPRRKCQRCGRHCRPGGEVPVCARCIQLIRNQSPKVYQADHAKRRGITDPAREERIARLAERAAAELPLFE